MTKKQYNKYIKELFNVDEMPTRTLILAYTKAETQYQRDLLERMMKYSDSWMVG